MIRSAVPPSSRRRAARVAGAVALATLSLGTGVAVADPATPAPPPVATTAADDFAGVAPDLRAQAARIVDELERYDDESQRLAEEYDQAVIAEQDARDAVEASKQRQAALDAQVSTLRTKVAGLALRAYTEADTVNGLAGAVAGGSLVADAAPRKVYTSVVLGIDLDAADQLARAEREAAAAARQVRDDLARASAARQDADGQRRALDDRAARQREQLDGLQSQIADAVTAEQQRRADEQLAAARRAIAEAAVARWTAEAAAPATTPSAAPTTTAKPTTAKPTATTPTTAKPTTTTAKPTTTTAKLTTTTAKPTTTTAKPTTTAGPTTTAARPATTAVKPTTSAERPTTTTTRPATSAPSTTARPTTTPRTATTVDASSSTTTTDPAPTTTVYRPPPPPSPNADVAVQAALSQVGVPYVFAGADPATGFDCSGLTAWAWAQAGVALPHSSLLQARKLPPVTLADIAPGDLVFTHDPISHVAIYIGGGRVVHAPSAGNVVTIAPLPVGRITAIGRP